MCYIVSTLKWFSILLGSRILHWSETFHKLHYVIMNNKWCGCWEDGVQGQKKDGLTRAKFSQVCFHG